MSGTLTGHLTRLDGTPSSGTVHVTPSVPHITDSAGHIVMSGPVRATLDVDGQVSISLPATDDEQLDPVGVTYTVRADLDHARWGPVHGVTIPDGATVDLSDLLVLPPVPARYSIEDRILTVSTTPPPGGLWANPEEEI